MTFGSVAGTLTFGGVSYTTEKVRVAGTSQSAGPPLTLRPTTTVAEVGPGHAPGGCPEDCGIQGV